VAESGVQFECKVADIFALRGWRGQPADAWLVMGEVIGVHIARHLLVDGVFDTFGAGIIQRGGGATAYAEIRADSRFDLERPRG
jgi:flavin reductase (DIM6/NTAB) family NADH-FMN oxidoreductase RutF